MVKTEMFVVIPEIVAGARRVAVRRPRILSLCAIFGFCTFFCFATIAGAQTTANDLLGAWSGEIKHDNESQKFALRFELDEKKAVVIYFYQPEMKFYNLGPGPVEQQGEEFKVPPMVFRLAPGELQFGSSTRTAKA